MNAHPLFVASERLESRRLFAVTLTDGVLTVEGTDGGDVISLVPRGSMLSVRVNAERTLHNLDAIDEVLVNALGGNDRITLGKLAVNAAVDAGAGDDRVTGGRGDDVIIGGDGNDRLSGGSGDDQLFGAAGSDKLFGNDGDDELDGGAGTDLLNGGNGFDLTDLGPDILIGVENQGGNTIVNGNRTTFGRIGTALRPLQPLDTTGFNVRPGNNVISPNLSSGLGGNATYFDPFTGVTLQAGGVFVNLPTFGAYGRELNQGSPGIAGAAIN